MEDFWLSAAKYGFGVVAMVIMAVAGWRFFMGHLWPRMLKQVDTAQERLDDQTKAFMEELKQQRETFLRTIDAQRNLYEKAYDIQKTAIQTVVHEIADKLRRRKT